MEYIPLSHVSPSLEVPSRAQTPNPVDEYDPDRGLRIGRDDSSTIDTPQNDVEAISSFGSPLKLQGLPKATSIKSITHTSNVKFGNIFQICAQLKI
jgi:hypothetical protein